jgi:hypothetical protein
MDDQAQFDIINQPNYFDRLKDKVNAIRAAMEELEASASEIRTRVEGVPVIVSFTSETEGRLRVGITSDGHLYDWTFPIRWLEPQEEV